MELTGKIVKEKQLTTIMVTHNLRYAVEYGDRLLMIHRGKRFWMWREKGKSRLKSTIF